MSLKIRFRASFDTFCAKHEGARSKDIFGRKWQFFRLFVRLESLIKSQIVRMPRDAFNPLSGMLVKGLRKPCWAS